MCFVFSVADYAQVLFRRCYAVSRLIKPGEGSNAEYARGLADALYGQGKVQEAKQVNAAGSGDARLLLECVAGLHKHWKHACARPRGAR